MKVKGVEVDWFRKHPYSERKAGDAVFFGGKCDCNDRETIHHVGLMM